MTAGPRPRATLVLLALGTVGCVDQYVVRRDVMERVASWPALWRADCAVAAEKEEDGDTVWVEAGQIGSVGADPRPDRVRITVERPRRNGLLVPGIVLSSLGALQAGAGIYWMADYGVDEGGLGSLFAIPLALGIAHLIPGIVMTAVGAAGKPAEVELPSAADRAAGLAPLPGRPPDACLRVPLPTGSLAIPPPGPGTPITTRSD